jgi:hypothetical protein
MLHYTQEHVVSAPLDPKKSPDLTQLDLYLWDHFEIRPILYSAAVSDVDVMRQK